MCAFEEFKQNLYHSIRNWRLAPHVFLLFLPCGVAKISAYKVSPLVAKHLSSLHCGETMESGLKLVEKK